MSNKDTKRTPPLSSSSPTQGGGDTEPRPRALSATPVTHFDDVYSEKQKRAAKRRQETLLKRALAKKMRDRKKRDDDFSEVMDL